MIEQVTTEVRTKTWRGEEKIEQVIRWHITGTITELADLSGPYGAEPRATVDADGQTAIAIGNLGGFLYKPEMRPARVGDRILIIAAEELLPGGEYRAYEIEQA